MKKGLLDVFTEELEKFQQSQFKHKPVMKTPMYVDKNKKITNKERLIREGILDE